MFLYNQTSPQWSRKTAARQDCEDLVLKDMTKGLVDPKNLAYVPSKYPNNPYTILKEYKRIPNKSQ